MGFDLSDFPAHIQEQVQRKNKTALRSNGSKKAAQDFEPGKAHQPDWPSMNRYETAYAQLLETRRLNGEITGYQFEPLNLRLGKSVFYKPDFLVQRSDGVLEIHEVKGYWEEDARVKFKVAAGLHPYFRFIAVQKNRLRDPWQYEYFN